MSGFDNDVPVVFCCPPWKRWGNLVSWWLTGCRTATLFADVQPWGTPAFLGLWLNYTGLLSLCLSLAYHAALTALTENLGL